MPFLVWSDKYLTGISKIDSDHENLFLIVNVLYDTVHNGQENTKVSPLLAALGEYVKKHFTAEELIMRSANYPGLSEHMEKHRALNRRVRRYIELADDNPEEININELLEFLKSWLTNHVLKSDMDYVPYVAKSKFDSTKAGLS